MHLKDLLAEAGARMGLPGLTLDSQGMCQLTFDKRWSIDIEDDPDEGRFHLYSPVAILPDEGAEPMLHLLLNAHLFGRGTAGAVFGLDSARGEILLVRSLPAEGTSVDDFLTALEAFVNQVENWTARLARLRSAAVPEDRPSEARPNTPPEETFAVRA